MTATPARESLTARNLENYDSPWSREQYGERMQGLFPIEAALLDQYLPSPVRVLDLGCGAGRTTVELRRRGHAVTGIDLSESLLAHARARHPDLDLRRMDASALAFEDRSFDAALFSYNGIDCLYPVESRVRCLSEVHRVLVPNGVFLISGHNAIGAIFSGGYFYLRGYANAARWIWRQRANPVFGEWYWAYDDPGGRQYLYSAPPDRTIDQARSVGFDVVKVVGATGETHPGRIRRRQQHVHFVLRKAGAAR
jgi:ubiquinone/menaquinone biosynthesis C-methylase UbiE